jgi:hypothetical protein
VTSPPAPNPPPIPAGQIGEGAVRFTHSGVTYVLGYGPDFWGIWDRRVPGPPVEQFPRSDEGWQRAWNHFIAIEVRYESVPEAWSRPAVSALPVNRLAIAAFVLGLVGIALLLTRDWTSGLGRSIQVALGAACFPLAIITGIWGLWKARDRAADLGLAIGAVVLGLVATLCAVDGWQSRTRSLEINRGDWGSYWVLTVDSGTLSCKWIPPCIMCEGPATKDVTFTARGTTYGLSGHTQSFRDRPYLSDITLGDPNRAERELYRRGADLCP